MRKRTFSIIFTVFLMMLSNSAGLTSAADAPKSKRAKQTRNRKQLDCSKTTDQQIVSRIQRRLALDPQIRPQMKGIRVTSRNRQVVIFGRIDGRGLKERITLYARSTRCVGKVINNINSLHILCRPCEIYCPVAKICVDRCVGCFIKTAKCKPGERTYNGGCVPERKKFDFCPPCERKRRKRG